MGSIDIKFYWAVFLRRLPYFLVITAFLTAVAGTIAAILPPVYRSEASMLVEPQQIPGDLAETTVPINPFEQAQIIEQRLMTRANLLDLANRVGIFAGEAEPMPANALIGDIRDRIEFIGFTPDVTQMRGVPGAIIIGVAFEGPTPELANKGANELVSLVLQENVRLRTGRAGDTLEFFESEVDKLSAALERQAARIAEFKTANVAALPDSMAARRAQQEREQQRLLALEREEAALRNQRATVVWVFERTGRSAGLGALSPEETELQALRSQLIQQRAIYNETSPTIRVLKTRIAALERLVAEQRAARAMPDTEGNAAAPVTDLDVELAPIDERLKFIADEKATIEATLADLDASIQATPANEMVLTGLEREMASLQTQYDQAMASRSQAQVGERIEVLSKGERFSLIEPPREPTRPYSPNRKLIAAAGLVGGVGTGLGFVFLLEMINRSIRRPVDLSNKLGIQPFATVPYIRTQNETRWKRSVILAVLFAILVAIPAALWLVHSYYMPLDLLLAPVLDPAGAGAGAGGEPPL
ncbi:MAG TPA: lipopolysaccharide biosynthesis protein [Amaricoccus sp.]|jgi:polysaccharide chain length determinant protein (PEP-CTERM system associated)|uniref:lipopolysaccharide biosynthesis protein n=1 Tax=Amaricoccus sp. TaxID=1872485 RepID=UPI002C08D90E|nr:lipopolysaccharide biosynthesis protein [Amaricoccus sp.]HMR51741.1 lipopolysaccharide biosynthesis protein [Amaricoccus sp.]HMT98625.1 lipopolysaccharide biosynthesis protein [Amaricoccus sp.]